VIHPSLRGRLRPTVLRPAPHISARTGLDVVLISEVGQITGSFKLRAAMNLALCTPLPRLLAASSGNFGAALAYAGAALGKPTTIVMPHTSAQVKIDAVRSHGATVDLIDVGVISRAARIAELAAADPGACASNAYDDPLIIAGNSTLGHELAEAALGLDVVVVPIGGGGLSSGVIEGLCERGDRTAVWCAEPLLANDAARSLRAGRRLSNAQEPQTIADGARTISVGVHNWAILQAGLSGITEVSEAAIAEGVRLLAAEGLRVEPTGALAIGALLSGGRPPGHRVGCVLSGGNVDEALYQSILRGETP
jgi:threonine dehydratase